MEGAVGASQLQAGKWETEQPCLTRYQMKHCVASCPRRAPAKTAAVSGEAMEPGEPGEPGGQVAQAVLVVPVEALEVMVVMTAAFAVDA